MRPGLLSGSGKVKVWRRLVVYEREQQQEQPREIVRTELDLGQIGGFGRRLSLDFFPTSGVMATK